MRFVFILVALHAISKADSYASEGDVRLTDPVTWSGRVEVYQNGFWGTVCGFNVEPHTIDFICRQMGMGYTGGELMRTFDTACPDQPIWIRNPYCEGYESRITECTQQLLGPCAHDQDLSIVCHGYMSHTTSGLDTSSYDSSSYGPCESSYSNSGSYGYTGQPIDSDIYTPVYYNGTGQPHDLGIRVRNWDARTSNGRAGFGGLLEVYYSGSWGTVCDDSFTDPDARVACRSLGYSDGFAVCCGAYGYGSDQILMDEVQCTGSESNIGSCMHNGFGSHDCHHSEDAGVLCF